MLFNSFYCAARTKNQCIIATNRLKSLLKTTHYHLSFKAYLNKQQSTASAVWDSPAWGLHAIMVQGMCEWKISKSQLLVRVRSWSRQPGVAFVEATWKITFQVSPIIMKKRFHAFWYLLAPGLYGTPTKDRPDRHTGSVLPVTLGHEACGRVFQTTPGCPLAVGQPVVVDPHLFCSKCHHCETSNNLCDDFGFLGLSGGGGGGFSQYFAVDWRACHPVPESLLGVACLIEPLAVARRALHRVGSCDWSSKTALILGGGPIGQAVLWNLRSFGCQNILCSEPAAIRQQQVKRAGGVVIDPSKADAVTVVQQTTGSRGADVVFDCAGLQSALDLGMAVLSKHGQYVMVASWSKPVRS